VRILYRASQFWRTVFQKTNLGELEQAQGLLSPAQWALFRQLQAAEQEHALRIFQDLQKQGEKQPDLLVAALLHDVGKLRYPLNPIERAMVVVMKALLPARAKRWGELPSGSGMDWPGWRKAFVVAEQHAAWGADLARKLGVTPLVESLIRYHHEPQVQGTTEVENLLRHKLWVIDNEN
jgi:putative nucleotidyltransferase with HDIG domain